METSILTQIIFPLSTFIIMLGLGMTLSLGDFRALSKYPKAVTLGLFAQLFLLPALAFSLAYFSNARPEMALGLMIIAVSPGGTASNILVHLSRGDTALSISLTALSSTLTFLTIPFYLELSGQFFGGEMESFHLPWLETFVSIALLTIIPVGLGMGIRQRFPQQTQRFLPGFNRFLGFFLVLIILGSVLKEHEHFLSFIQESGLLTLGLNISALTLGFLLSRLLKLKPSQAKAVCVEIGIQNVPLALTISLSILQDSRLSVPVVTYGGIMFITGLLFLYLSKKWTSPV